MYLQKGLLRKWKGWGVLEGKFNEIKMEGLGVLEIKSNEKMEREGMFNGKDGKVGCAEGKFNEVLEGVDVLE